MFAVIFLMMVLLFDRSILSFALSNAGTSTAEDSESIKRTIKLYNGCFQDFYASGGLHAKLDEFPAAIPVKHELFRDIGFLATNQRVMVYDEADLKFLKMKMLAPNKADVDVLEEWNFLYQKLPERSQLTKVRGLAQGFRYHLQQVKGRWLVLDWEPIDVKMAGNNEFLF